MLRLRIGRAAIASGGKPPTQHSPDAKFVVVNETIRSFEQLLAQFLADKSNEPAALDLDIDKRSFHLLGYFLHDCDIGRSRLPLLAGWRVSAHSHRSHEDRFYSDSPRHRHVPGKPFPIGAFPNQRKRCLIGFAELNQHEFRVSSQNLCFASAIVWRRIADRINAAP